NSTARRTKRVRVIPRGHQQLGHRRVIDKSWQGLILDRKSAAKIGTRGSASSHPHSSSRSKHLRMAPRRSAMVWRCRCGLRDCVMCIMPNLGTMSRLAATTAQLVSNRAKEPRFSSAMQQGPAESPLHVRRNFIYSGASVRAAAVQAEEDPPVES